MDPERILGTQDQMDVEAGEDGEDHDSIEGIDIGTSKLSEIFVRRRLNENLPASW